MRSGVFWSLLSAPGKCGKSPTHSSHVGDGVPQAQPAPRETNLHSAFPFGPSAACMHVYRAPCGAGGAEKSGCGTHNKIDRHAGRRWLLRCRTPPLHHPRPGIYNAVLTAGHRLGIQMRLRADPHRSQITKSLFAPKLNERVPGVRPNLETWASHWRPPPQAPPPLQAPRPRHLHLLSGSSPTAAVARTSA